MQHQHQWYIVADFLLWPGEPSNHKPQDVQFVFESSGFFSQAGQLVITVLNLYQLLLQILTVDPVVILGSLQPKARKFTKSFWLSKAVGGHDTELPPVTNLKFSSCNNSNCCWSWLCFLPDGVLGSSNVSSWLARSVKTSFSANKLFRSSWRRATCPGAATSAWTLFDLPETV